MHRSRRSGLSIRILPVSQNGEAKSGPLSSLQTIAGLNLWILGVLKSISVLKTRYRIQSSCSKPGCLAASAVVMSRSSRRLLRQRRKALSVRPRPHWGIWRRWFDGCLSTSKNSLTSIPAMPGERLSVEGFQLKLKRCQGAAEFLSYRICKIGMHLHELFDGFSWPSAEAALSCDPKL